MQRPVAFVILLAACDPASSSTDDLVVSHVPDPARAVDLVAVVAAGDGQALTAVRARLHGVLRDMPRAQPAPDLRVTVLSPCAQPLCTRGGYAEASVVCGRAPVGPAYDAAIACMFEPRTSCPMMPMLETARRALERPGLLRPDTELALLLVTDADDPGLTTEAIEGHVQALLSRVPATRLVVSVLAPAAAPRWRAFVDALAARQVRSATMFAHGEAQVDHLLFGVGERLPIGRAPLCVPPTARDTDPQQAGLQPRCLVIDHGPAAGGGSRRQLPACSGGVARPCWRLEADLTGCVAVHIERGCVPAPGSTVELRCARRDPDRPG